MQQSQEMQAVHQQLQETIQTLHRKAVDADQILDNLQRDQKGKFAAVFADDSGFTTSAKRFGPYVQEIASDWQALKELDDDAAKQALSHLPGAGYVSEDHPRDRARAHIRARF